MKNLPHGIISIILAGLAIFVGIIAVFEDSIILAMLYLAANILGFLIIVYSYCTKCAGRAKCAHVILGKITKLLPHREQSKYSFFDYAGVVVPFILIVAFPQFYLIKHFWMLIGFWLFLLVAILEINKYVCITCVNSKCLLCKNKCLIIIAK
jgi:hypothetical protein